MDESVRDLLVRGTAAARVGDVKEARFYLEWALDRDLDTDDKVDALYWLAIIASDPAEKRNRLEEVLAIQPFHILARRELLILDGKLDERDIIDPNSVKISVHGERNPEIKSFTCPNCGGRMVYTPDGGALTCEFCESRKPREVDSHGSRLSEKDFLLSMATLQGHSSPEDSLAIECTACGIQFVLPPATLSFTCPYCATVYVVNEETGKTTITPSGIIPAGVSREAAKAIIQGWLQKRAMHDQFKDISLKGIYLPVWCFSFGGEVSYKYYLEHNDHGRSLRELIHGTQPVLRQNVMVPAETRYHAQICWQITDVDAGRITAYQPDFLTDWAAETYQISVAAASLDARQIAFQLEKNVIRAQIPGNAEDVSYDSHKLMVDGYKLFLVPAWLGEIRTSDRTIQYYLNADSGKLLMDNDDGGLKRWLKTLLNIDE